MSGSVIVTGDRNVVQSGQYNVPIGQAGGVTIGDRSPATARKPSKGITMIPVESSMVDSVGYDVPPEVFQGLLEAESKGQYMRAYIIDVYPYRRGPCRKKEPDRKRPGSG